MPDLYSYLVRKFSEYETTYKGFVDNIKTNEDKLLELKKQIKSDQKLSAISDFMANSKTEAIDGTPIFSNDTEERKQSCNWCHFYYGDNHHENPCALVGNYMLGELFKCGETYLLILNEICVNYYGYKCYLIYYQPNQKPTHCRVEANRYYSGMPINQIRKKYEYRGVTYADQFGWNTYNPIIGDLLGTHKLKNTYIC